MYLSLFISSQLHVYTYIYTRCVCMYIFMYVCMYVCMYSSRYMYIYIYIYTYIYIDKKKNTSGLYLERQECRDSCKNQNGKIMSLLAIAVPPTCLVGSMLLLSTGVGRVRATHSCLALWPPRWRFYALCDQLKLGFAYPPAYTHNYIYIYMYVYIYIHMCLA